MLAAVVAKGSALASRRKSRYSRHRAMPLAVKERRERHQSAPAVRGLTDERSQIRDGQCSASAETTRTFAQEQDSILNLLKRGQTSINSNLTAAPFGSDRPSDPIPIASRGRNRGSILTFEQASRDFHKPSGFTTGKDSTRRPGRSGSRLNRSLKKSPFFSRPFSDWLSSRLRIDRIGLRQCQP
jgi:hypothetical protein